MPSPPEKSAGSSVGRRLYLWFASIGFGAGLRQNWSYGIEGSAERWEYVNPRTRPTRKNNPFAACQGSMDEVRRSIAGRCGDHYPPIVTRIVAAPVAHIGFGDVPRSGQPLTQESVLIRGEKPGREMANGVLIQG